MRSQRHASSGTRHRSPHIVLAFAMSLLVVSAPSAKQTPNSRTPGPSAPPTSNARFDINECIADNLAAINAGGELAIQANKEADEADDAVKMTQAFSRLQQVMTRLRGDGLDGPLDDGFYDAGSLTGTYDTPCPPPDGPESPTAKDPPPGDDSPAAQLWHDMRNDDAQAHHVETTQQPAGQSTDVCDQLHDAEEQFTRAATLVDDAGGAPLESVFNFIKSVEAKAPPATAAAMNASVNAQMIADLNAGIDSSGALVDELLANAAGAADEQLKHACGTFSGPFQATMEAHFFAKDGGEWWTYTTTIAGTLRLSYPQASSPSNTALSGEFTGTATNFTYATDPYAHLSLTKGAVVKKIETAPAPDPDTTGFEIPVSGTLSGSDVTLTLGTAAYDFDPVTTVGKTRAVIISPLALIPVVNRYTMPYVNAHFMLQHFFHGGAPWNVTTNGSARDITVSDTEPRLDGPSKATYVLTAHLCDPACGGGQ